MPALPEETSIVELSPRTLPGSPLLGPDFRDCSSEWTAMPEKLPAHRQPQLRQSLVRAEVAQSHSGGLPHFSGFRLEGLT